MTDVPSPADVFDDAVDEGNRRLEQSLLELASTSFIAGFTIVFGIVALGIVEGIVEPEFGDLAKLAGALAFGPGLVFVVVGRTELFNENFFDPTAAAVDDASGWLVRPLLRLWTLTFVFNLAGGCLIALIFAVDGALPPGAAETLTQFATETAARGAETWFARGIAGGALITLLSYLLLAVDTAGSRIALAYVVGFFLALGPFDHVVVTVLHVFFGLLFGAEIGLGRLAYMTAVVTAGNLVGGLGLVTFSHVTQIYGARDEDQS
ncbi:formate/nitrite transporter [Salinarchaeum sp. Harcht-Bsk1]|uniref:formate/nitrite transporter family protein n=1 Tax=Salinarchaeum sp. Harcht-Bsk1 TaxID=1333523 RepID=UPI0003424737|nr:formate/nitrite transporter family protein [Salinarchaeum sp. Harcht-Bsk1]AGN02798.1 formate/nitrite transporter [Salinarchaeum sp. Harcht-Bsk1]